VSDSIVVPPPREITFHKVGVIADFYSKSLAGITLRFGMAWKPVILAFYNHMCKEFSQLGSVALSANT